MAMNKNELLAIFNNLSDESLLKALSAVGIELPGELELGEEEAEGMEPWSSKEVKIAPANKPTLIDKTKFEQQPQMPVRRPQYYDPMQDAEGVAEYITPDGTV